MYKKDNSFGKNINPPGIEPTTDSWGQEDIHHTHQVVFRAADLKVFLHRFFYLSL